MEKTKEEVFELIKTFLKKDMHVCAFIQRSSHLHNDLGIDSLERVELVMDLEKTYRIDLPDDGIQYMETVDDVINTFFDYLKKAQLPG